MVVSGSYYVTQKDDHDLYTYFNSLPSSEERILAYIEGVDGSLLPSGVSAQSIGDFVSSYLPWWSDEDCLIVKFEDLDSKLREGKIVKVSHADEPAVTCTLTGP